MTLRRRLPAAFRTLVTALFIGALLVRVMVPAGWMPGDSAHGATLQLCFDAGGADAAIVAKIRAELAAHGVPLGDDKHLDKTQHCDFAASAQALLTPALPTPLALPRAIEAPARAQVAQVIPGRGLAAPPPPATGPPHLA